MIGKIWYFHLKESLYRMMVLNHQRMHCSKRAQLSNLIVSSGNNDNNASHKQKIQIILLHVVEQVHIRIPSLYLSLPEEHLRYKRQVLSV